MKTKPKKGKSSEKEIKPKVEANMNSAAMKKMKSAFMGRKSKRGY